MAGSTRYTTRRRRSVPPWGTMGRVGFDSRTFPPWMAGHPCLTLRARSLSLQGDPANIGKGCSRPAHCTRGSGDRFGIPNPRKNGSVIRADRQTVWSLLCVAESRATRPNGEWEYSTGRQCWATSAQRRCHPEEALYLPTFSHLFDRQQTSLSVSLSDVNCSCPFFCASFFAAPDSRGYAPDCCRLPHV